MLCSRFVTVRENIGNDKNELSSDQGVERQKQQENIVQKVVTCIYIYIFSSHICCVHIPVFVDGLLHVESIAQYRAYSGDIVIDNNLFCSNQSIFVSYFEDECFICSL